jgi:N6-L-threonylcarbamoyladenine synthase
MIGAAAHYRYIDGKISDMYLNAVPNLKIGES